MALPLELDLIIVDDDSPDGTGVLADSLVERYPGLINVIHRVGERGLKSAYLRGFSVALEKGAQAITQMDADLSHDPAVLPVMAKRLDSGHDIVLGSRYIPGGQVDVNWSYWRKLLSAWANYYVRTILKLPYMDITSGYRLWRAEALRRLPLELIKADGYIFLVEMIYLAYLHKLKVTEVPIYFSERQKGRSKMTFRIQAEAAARILQLRWEYARKWKAR